MDKISIVIPFLNEEENIERLSIALNSFIAKHPTLIFEVILVNDGSTDASVKKIIATKFTSSTKLINLSRNFGSHAALRAGIKHATGDLITFLYADLQDGIDNVINMYAEAIKGFDIVWAFRANTNNSKFDKLFSKLYARLMKKYVNKKYPDKGFDVVMFNRKVGIQLNQNVESNSSIFLQILDFGFNDTSIEYEKTERKAGKSKWTISKKVKLLIDSFVAFSFAPIRFVTIVGIIFFLFGVGWSVYITFRRIYYNDLASGWPALTSILLIGFGITNISLGIIAEYLWRTLDASRKRPVFIIDDIVEIIN